MSTFDRSSFIRGCLVLALVVAGLAGIPVLAQRGGGVLAPSDEVMADPSEVGKMLDWASAAFAGVKDTQAGRRVELSVLRQDHNVLCFGESCMETPITIGRRQFKHGLGTHANSEITVSVPLGAKTFKAFVGVDNNYDTQGKHGSGLPAARGTDGQQGRGHSL